MTVPSSVTTTSVAGTPPIVTLVTSSSAVPEIVRVVPPVTEPDAGEMAVTAATSVGVDVLDG
ncbi:hypothetical protein GCM10008097_15340 [Mycetocola manganoxydans]|nr:hypothetical protein GCM10008097_15340 [Mycetocola manganoxydans]